MKNWPLNQVQMSDKFYMDFSFKPIKRFRIFLFLQIFAPKSLVPNTMQIQFRYKHYELDLQKTAKYAVDYIKDYLLVSKRH